MRPLVPRLSSRPRSWHFLKQIALASALAIPLAAGITWPSSQILPSFPAPAPTQDLIILRGATQQWQAEGAGMGHKTGRAEGEGWLCQVGIDPAANHMVYGPYDTSVPAGPNTAQFRMKIDNNTANDDAVVDIDVRDTSNGQILAARTITRKAFAIAGDYVTFDLPFTLSADGHALEFRVYWYGGAYTKVDWVGVTRSKTDDEMVLFASLKGIVNVHQPRIFSYEGDAFAEGQYTWLQSLGLGWTEVSDKWSLITKYRNELAGVIVYDNAVPDTINLATTLAGSRKALVAGPNLVSTLTAAPYNLPILMDLRGQFADKLAVYNTLYNTYWPSLTHKLAFGLNPNAVKAAVREYAVAVGAASLWLDPAVPAESALLNKFLASMGAGSVWMGWWPEEAAGVAAGSNYGISTVASDWATNLTMHSGMPRVINVKPMPAKPALQNKLYVAFILSDGDNLQYVEHLMRKLWNNPDRGKVPIGWTLSPAMVDAMPGALNFYWNTATNNDCLISGPSGYGYTYPNLWTNAAQLDQFVARTEAYNQVAGFRVITIWNTITGGINTNVGNSFANNASTLLGLTAQNTGGGLSIYNSKLPGMALSCNYCTGEQAMKDHIASAAAGWNGAEPRFIIIQAQPWTDVKPSNFLAVANTLGSSYVVVRPDHIFQLIREAKGLPINPGTTTYTLTASAGANGAISPSGSIAVNAGASQTFTIQANAGYAISAVTVDGVNIGAVGSYTFSAVSGNHSISASFSAIAGPAGYTWCAGENGSFTLPGTCDVAYGANGSFSYLYGRTGTITFNNATFGDPAPGVAKAGFYKSTIVSSNLALGKAASASSTETSAYPASAAFDGNAGTRWSSTFTDPSWITVDLGSAMAINKVVLRWEAAYGKAYQIQVSTDNAAWSTVFTQNAGAGGVETLTFPQTTARYVRMYGTARGTAWGYSLFEFEVYNDSAAPTTFTLTASAGTGGSINPGTVTVNAGASQTFTVAAASGYSLSAVMVDGASVGAVGSYTFSNVTGNHTIAVTFAPGGVAAWASGVHYLNGALVTYGGRTWKNAYEHTSQPDWYPGASGIWFWTAQ